MDMSREAVYEEYYASLQGMIDYCKKTFSSNRLKRIHTQQLYFKSLLRIWREEMGTLFVKATNGVGLLWHLHLNEEYTFIRRKGGSRG